MLTQIPGASRSPELHDSFPAGATAHILLSHPLSSEPPRSSVHRGNTLLPAFSLCSWWCACSKMRSPSALQLLHICSVHGALCFSSDQLLGPTLRSSIAPPACFFCQCPDRAARVAGSDPRVPSESVIPPFTWLARHQDSPPGRQDLHTLPSAKRSLPRPPALVGPGVFSVLFLPKILPLGTF